MRGGDYPGLSGRPNVITGVQRRKQKEARERESREDTGWHGGGRRCGRSAGTQAIRGMGSPGSSEGTQTCQHPSTSELLDNKCALLCAHSMVVIGYSNKRKLIHLPIRAPAPPLPSESVLQGHSSQATHCYQTQPDLCSCVYVSIFCLSCGDCELPVAETPLFCLPQGTLPFGPVPHTE